MFTNKFLLKVKVPHGYPKKSLLTLLKPYNLGHMGYGHKACSLGKVSSTERIAPWLLYEQNRRPAKTPSHCIL